MNQAKALSSELSSLNRHLDDMFMSSFHATSFLHWQFLQRESAFGDVRHKRQEGLCSSRSCHFAHISQNVGSPTEDPSNPHNAPVKNGTTQQTQPCRQPCIASTILQSSQPLHRHIDTKCSIDVRIASHSRHNGQKKRIRRAGRQPAYKKCQNGRATRREHAYREPGCRARRKRCGGHPCLY